MLQATAESPLWHLQEPLGQRPEYQETKCNYRKPSGGRATALTGTRPHTVPLPGRVHVPGRTQTLYIRLRKLCPVHPESVGHSDMQTSLRSESRVKSQLAKLRNSLQLDSAAGGQRGRGLEPHLLRKVNPVNSDSEGKPQVSSLLWL